MAVVAAGEGGFTHVNVDRHAVALEAVHRGRHHDERLLTDKVADAPLLLVVLGAAVRRQLELEGAGGAGEQQQAAEPLQRGGA